MHLVKFTLCMLRFIVAEVGNLHPAKGSSSPTDSSDHHYSPANVVHIMNDCVLDCVEAASSMKDLIPTINDYPSPKSDSDSDPKIVESKEGIFAIPNCLLIKCFFLCRVQYNMKNKTFYK